MATMQQSTAFCQTCNRQTLVARQQPAHMLHFIATVLTCSLWLVPWALVALAPRRWRCQTCGGKHMAGQHVASKGEPVSRLALTAQQLVGVPVGEFGSGAMRTSRPVSEVMV